MFYRYWLSPNRIGPDFISDGEFDGLLVGSVLESIVAVLGSLVVSVVGSMSHGYKVCFVSGLAVTCSDLSAFF